MRIRDEAVEAAVDALVMTRMGDYNIEMNEFRKAAREVLTAAAPFIAAQAWDEGDRNGRSRAMRMMSDEPNLPLLIPNPYRSGS